MGGDELKNVVLFGAGRFGRLAYPKYKDRIAYWIDNNTSLQGRTLYGKEIKKVEDYVKDKNDYAVIITSKTGVEAMYSQLKELGVENISVYRMDQRSYFESDELILNIYDDNPLRNLNEDEYNNNTKRRYIREEVNKRTEDLYQQKRLFCQVEIETINRCNGYCSFCPVSKNNDKREEKKMSDDLFKKIIKELRDIDYDGKLSLFSNNEPLLDDNIGWKYKYAKENVPKAKLQMYTNGTLLTLDKFREIVKYADEIVIDNYNDDLTLIKPVEIIAEYCEEHPELKKKVTIALRKANEILSTRGGDAPNRKEKISFENDRCNLPFEEMIIRPDGKLSLCCCDPYGRDTLGDLNKQTMLEAWFGKEYREVRDALYKGRGNWEHCKYCDHFGIL